jgi:hypothetical protein
MTTQANDADFAFFTPAVKPMLHRIGSHGEFTRTEDGSAKTNLGLREIVFITDRDSFHVAAIGQDRWPYTQRHRGPKGFICVLNETILGFASIANNRRYISPGNALLFLIDHTLQARLKIWADAEVSEDPALIEKLAKTRGHGAASHLAFLFHVRGFSWNYDEDNVKRSAREVRTEKENPIQRGSTKLNWRQCDTTIPKAGASLVSVLRLKNLPYTKERALVSR